MDEHEFAALKERLEREFNLKQQQTDLRLERVELWKKEQQSLDQEELRAWRQKAALKAMDGK